MKRLTRLIHPTSPEKLAGPFIRTGWTVCIIQGLFALVPIILLTYVLISGNRNPNASGVTDVTTYLSVIGWVILFATTLWFYRYTRLGKKLKQREIRPSKPSVIRQIWVGLILGCMGIVVSVSLLFGEILRLLLVFLRTPQGAVPVFSPAADASAWVSAIDMVGLLSDVCVLSAELVAVTLSLWLLFRLLPPSASEKAVWHKE